ncbi:hypothetical protein POTOM_041683 [Populus tomentosa]|uniref:Vesicle transport protein n=1 Tax=Populus tomentosa TaxID=118781 RepID=A0A8X7YMJ3_POPTO|nr:hypothetical protein POTOM_041683 [Populus tomentosa]
MWKLNQFLSGDDEEREESFLEEESDGFCSLSPTQRMYAFAASLVAGLALMFLACPPFGPLNLPREEYGNSCHVGDAGKFRMHLRENVLAFVIIYCDILNAVFQWKHVGILKLLIALQNLFVLQSLIVFAKPIKFALLFTFGNVLAVGSTAFLIGPGRQLGMMFDPARIYATAIYIGCVVLALICALLIHKDTRLELQHLYNSFSEFNNRKFFWHFKCFVRYTYLPSLSYFRYSLSYIPFARRMVSNLMIRLCDTEL